MQRMELNLSWFQKKLESLCVYNGNTLEKVLSFKDYLKTITLNQLQNEQWSLSEFLVLAMMFNLIDELCSNNKTTGSIYRNDWVNGTGIIRPLMACDIKEAQDKFIQYYHEKFNFLKQLTQVEGIEEFAAPVVWLELVESVKSDLYVQRYVTTYEMTNDNPPLGVEIKKTGGVIELVRPELSKLIRYKAFLLSEEEEKNASDGFPYVYTLEELASRWKTNEKNIIVACSKSVHFYPYISISEGTRLFERSLPITTTMINENLRNGNLQSDYKYGLKGYVRLTKKSELPHKITLEYFHANKTINPQTISYGNKCSSCIWVDPPFCKYILGIYQFIEVTNSIEPTLFFLANEVHGFEKTDEFPFLSNGQAKSILEEVTFNFDNKIEKHVEYQDNESVLLESEEASNADVNQLQVNFSEKMSLDEQKKNQFFKNGNCYEIHFEDKKLFLKSSKGLGYIECLLKKIKQEIHVNELEIIVNKVALHDQSVSLNEMENNNLDDISNFSPDVIADERAIKEVNAALIEVKEELELAKEINDIERIEKLEEAIEKYNQYLSGATGKYYKPRKVPDKDERARKRVFSAIQDALKIIQLNNEALFLHLSQAIKTGEFCVYKPVAELSWV